MAALEIFDCERMRARMSTAGCARLWNSVAERPPGIGEARQACVGCELGARHAGVDIEVALRAARASELAGACARCGRPGLRMIRGTHCVSCYNRLREVAAGRDARGRVPRFARAVHPVTLVLAGLGAAETTKRFPAVSSLAEAILLAAKGTAGARFAAGIPRLSALPPLSAPEFGPDFAPILRPVRRRQPRALGLPPSFAGADGQLFLFHA